MKFAANFGRLLGKIFWPITLLMGVFDFITGFIDGFKEDGILGGLEGGLTKMLVGLIGMPLDLLKKGIEWILGKFGFDNAKATLEAFSFKKLITDMFSSLFGMIKGAVNWVKQLFTDPVAALKALWDGAMGGLKTLSDVVMWPINTAINWILGVFGLKEEGAPKFSFFDFVFGKDGIFAKAWKWITGIFSWGKEDEKAGDGFSLSGLLLKALDGIKTWLGNMFKFDSAGELFATAFNVLTFLPNIIFKGLQLISKWLLGLFGFDSAAEKVANADNWTIGSLVVGAFKAVKKWIVGLFSWGQKAGEIDGKKWSLLTMITSAVDSIFEWFKGIFDIDWNGMMTSLIPDWAPDWFKDALTPAGATEQASERLGESKERTGEIVKQELDINADATRARTNIKQGTKQRRKELQTEIANEQAEIAGGDAKGGVWGMQYERADRIKEREAELATLDSQEAAELAKVNQKEQEQLAPLQQESVRLQTEMAADEKIIAEGSQTTASAVQNSLPHMRTDIGLAMGVKHTPGNEIAAASSNMFSGGGGTNLVNAPVTTNSSSSTVVNVQTPRMATDPNTQKQSGYALSGWAKFD